MFLVMCAKAIVDEANRLNRSCAAHAHGRNGLAAAIAAGVCTIEHGSWLDEELAKQMAANGQVFVPTRYIVQFCADMVLGSGEVEYNEESKAKMAGCIERNQNALRVAMANGVTIAAGTDIGIWDTWGQNAKELKHFVEGGMSTLEAIECSIHFPPPIT